MNSKPRKKQPNKKVRKKSTQKKKYPLRGKPVIYHEPFKPVDLDEPEIFPRVPGIDKSKVVIMPDFDDPLEEFGD
jgi:hypothetical protein